MKHANKIAQSEVGAGELNQAICRYVEEIERLVPADISAAELAEILRDRQNCADLLSRCISSGSICESVIALANSTDDYYGRMMSMPLAILAL